MLMYCGLPGWLPRRPDRGRHRGARGRGRHPARQRRLPRPAAAARTRPRRRAMIVALRALRGAADGDSARSSTARWPSSRRRRGGRALTARSTSTCPTTAVDAALRARLAGRSTPAAAGPAHVLRAVARRGDRAHRRPASPSSSHQGVARTSRPGATSPKNRRLFRLDRVRAAEVLDTPAEADPEVPALDLTDGAVPARRRRRPGHAPAGPEARWVAEYYPVEATQERRRRRARGRPPRRGPALAGRLLLRLAPRRGRGPTPGVRRGGHRRRDRTRSGFTPSAA